MGWIELSDGPDGLRARAAKFSGSADELAGNLQALLAEIAAVEAGQPWGSTDPYAAAFEKSYNQPTDAGPFHEAVDEQARGLGPEAAGMGNALTAGASDYQTEDIRAAGDIGGVI
jgi:hypothetical protein